MRFAMLRDDSLIRVTTYAILTIYRVLYTKVIFTKGVSTVDNVLIASSGM